MKVAMRNNTSFTLSAPLVAGDETFFVTEYVEGTFDSELQVFLTAAVEGSPVIACKSYGYDATTGIAEFQLTDDRSPFTWYNVVPWAGQTIPTGTVLELRVCAEMIKMATNNIDELTAKYAVLISEDTGSTFLGAAAEKFVGIGNGVCVNTEGVAIGFTANESGAYSTAVGASSSAQAEGSTAVGYGASARANGAISMGDSYARSVDSIAIGQGADAINAYSVALGRGSSSTSVCHADISALFCLPSAAADGTPLDADDKLVRHRAVPMSAISSQLINLATVAGAVQVSLPSGMRLYIDRIDVIQTATSTATTTPQLSIGTSSTEKTSILAASDITVAARYARQSFTPATAAGVTSIYIDVPKAANAAKLVRVVFTGYLAA